MDPALLRRCHDALEPVAAAVFGAPELQEHLTAAGLDRGRMCAYAGRAAPLVEPVRAWSWPRSTPQAPV